MTDTQRVTDAPCLVALRQYQQADEEGITVLASRQAIEETLALAQSQAATIAEQRVAETKGATTMAENQNLLEAVSNALQRIDIERGTGPIVNPAPYDAEARRFIAMMDAYMKARRE